MKNKESSRTSLNYICVGITNIFEPAAKGRNKMLVISLCQLRKKRKKSVLRQVVLK